MSLIQNQPYHLFNRRLLFNRQRRFSSSLLHFLDHEVIHTLVDRLRGIKRQFNKVLILGRAGHVYREIFKDVEVIVCPDTLFLDDEFLPFQPHSFDLVISHLSWHWVNDLPGTLIQVRNILEPDGLMMASLFGGHSLWQLRQCLDEAQEILMGGICPRIAPMIAPHDGAALLQRAGFALPVADHDRIMCHYDTVADLLKDLRIFGQTNMLFHQHKGIPPRQLFEMTEKIYQEKFASPQGRIEASANVIYLTGWHPSPNQQQPLLPGSGQIDLQQLLSA